MKFEKILHTIYGFLISSVLLCSCGGGDPENIVPTPTPTPDPTPSPTPKPAALKLSRHNETDLYRDANIPVGNYSGITPIGEDLYAVADDKLYGAGFVLMKLEMDGQRGKIISGERTIPTGTLIDYPINMNTLNWEDPSSWPAEINDAEGIVYYKKNNTIFIACEEGHLGPRIVEYDLDGIATGREMTFPEGYCYYTDENGNKHYNWNDESYGLESLAYNEKTERFWTTTEQSLRSDKKEGEKSSLLRIQSFGEDLKPANQYLYQTDENKYDNGIIHIWGVTDILALDDGRLIIMEREVCDTAWQVKLYLVDPTKTNNGSNLEKTLLLLLDNEKDKLLADYEGMCFGPKLNDGRQTIFLIADANNSKGGILSLYNALKVLVIDQQ